MSNETLVRVAAVQMTSGSDKARNVERAVELVRGAAGEGATYIQLPEYFNFLGPQRRFSSVSEDIPGPTTTRLSDVAASLGVTVHLGSLLERTEDDAKCFNTSVVIGPSGEFIATYRKVHLFDVDVPGAVAQHESDAIAPGERLVVALASGVHLGLSICFDLRFAELYRALSLGGANVLAIPAAFNAVTGLAHWEVLVRARAIENHAFVVAAAQAGMTDEGIATFGHSMIVGPWGEVLAASNAPGEDIVLATLDIADVERRRSHIAVLALRRPTVYAAETDVLGDS